VGAARGTHVRVAPHTNRYETTITLITNRSNRRAAAGQGGAAADDLDLRGAVVGNGLALTQGRDGRLSIHELSGGTARHLGSYANAADAWRLLDELDLAEVDDLDLAA
jgi:hypothetical protein